jgi:glycosyltransferase involved in cell wall biosynthesis
MKHITLDTYNTLTIEIIICTFQRTEMLLACLDSISASFRKLNYALKLKISLVFNGESSSNTQKQTFDDLSRQGIELSFMISKQPLTPAAARNLVLKNLKNEWILFLDDDVIIPTEFFNNFYKLALKYPDIDVWGGPNLASFEQKSNLPAHIYSIENILIVGPIAKRYTILPPALNYLFPDVWGLMMCNLFVRADYFKNLVLDSSLETAEENLLLFNLSRLNAKFMYSPELSVIHNRRHDISSFLNRIYDYGRGRGQILFHSGLSAPFLLILIPTLAFFSMLASANTLTWLFSVFIWLVSAHVYSYFFIVKLLPTSTKLFFLPLLIFIYYYFGIIKGVLNRHVKSVQFLLSK